MEKLSVRRARIDTINRYQAMGKTEKSSGASQAGRAGAARTGQGTDVVSETLKKLMGHLDRVGQQAKEGRRILRTGEATLAEVEDALERMEELAHQAAESEPEDRAALQGELERLRSEIDRIIQGGIREGLFQDGESAGADALDALLEGLEAQQEGAQDLPSWLLKAMLGPAPSREALLSALGAAQGASGRELLAALGKLPLENSAAGYLAGLYLGAVISGGIPSGSVDSEQAARGLERLLELVTQGVPLDEAVDLLTGGLFSGMDDFCAQFTGGTAPGLEAFLTGLLGKEAQTADLAALLAGGGEGELDLLLDLLMALDGGGNGLGLLPDMADEAPSGSEPLAGSETPAGNEAPIGDEAPAGGEASTGAENFGHTDTPQGLPARQEIIRLGTVLASGRGVTADPDSGEVTVSGGADPILRGQGQADPPVRLTGSGTVTLQGMDTALKVETTRANVVLAGENTLREVALGEGSVLVLEGDGLTTLQAVRGGPSGVLRLTGGAFVLAGDALGDGQTPAVIADGPVSLLAAEHVLVQNPQGERLSPLDFVWKTMLPGWSVLTSLMVDGKQKRLALTAGDHPDPLRLWLARGNEHLGYPAHSIVFQGRDRAGNLRVRYTFVRWNQKSGTFQEIVMYPNPFNVTGGEAETDWHYEQESQTLRILSAQVTAVSGGTGIDGDAQPFSGRLALADELGETELTLSDVTCRVSAGRAFQLGRGNRVTLLLEGGSENVFESGPGFAGISLGPGTSLTIDRADKGQPEGRLTAIGGAGGAGIGRDKGAGQERCGAILIRGGTIIATGSGGGAGIGGALGAKAGDIRIQGGSVTAQAACSASAIGAGIQGSCGDITVTSFAHVVRARGGGPGGDIGGCLFGGCGKVQVSAGANLDGSKLWNREGLSLQVGEATLTVPRFQISAQTLRLEAVDLSTRETAQAALSVLSAGRRWVSRLQGAYGVMYGQLTQNVSGVYSVRQPAGVVREDRIADLLLHDARVVLRQDPLAPYRLRGMENAGLLLR